MEEKREDRQPDRRRTEGNDSYLPIGKVGRPHGIKGEVKIHPYSGDPEILPDYPALMMVSAGKQPLGSYRVTGGRVHGKAAILRLEGINSRGQAETLIGCEVWVEKTHLPPLAEEEFYWQEMVGRRVVTTDGRELGEVTGFMATGAHDILVVTGDGREYLIPATPEFMVETEDETGAIVIQPVPGLLEINEP
jgi:16S rRNA processing protein RimM